MARKARARDELVGQREGAALRESRQAVQRRGKGGWHRARASAAGLDHGHFGGPVDFVLHADAVIEADEVCAAAEEDVLAVVDDFVDAGMQIGGGAAAEVATALDELHAIAGFSERAGGAHAGDAAADDGDGAGGGL